MPKLIVIPLLAALIVLSAQPLPAQDQSSPNSAAQEREALHLTTIGTFSAGFTLQSYGYIGVLADVLSKGIYSQDMVISMLGETTKYLRNILAQLKKYHGTPGLVPAGDLKFISNMMEIVELLIAEAEALSSFARTKSADDLKKFEESRKSALKKIKKTFGMN